MSKYDLTGQRFDHLYVDHRVEDHITKGGNHLVAYACICDCGKHKVVLGQKLRTGRAKSCGECGIYKDNSSIIGRRFNHFVNDKMLLIELQGGHHYFPVDWFGGEEKFKIQCEHDKLKLDYASAHDIPLLCINCHNKSANYILDKLTNFLSNF